MPDVILCETTSLVCKAIKLNVQEAIDIGLYKLGFEEIRVNQCCKFEQYNNRQDVFMISPTGSGKSLTLHTAPFVFDF